MKNTKHIAIVGAGIAGLEAASHLSKEGFQVTVFEKENKSGGKLNNWSKLFPDFAEPDSLLQNLRTQAEHSNINIIYNTEISSLTKSNGRFELSDSNKLKCMADAVMLSPGFSLFDASLKEEYGYKIFDNVITSADFETLHKQEKKLLTKNGEIPKRVAIVHCVGSRDAKSGNTYCSKVCCITGVKQAIEINKQYPQCEVFNFYMDLRLYGSKFDSLYLEAQKQHKIQFIRGRLSEVSEKQDSSLQIKAEDTLSGRPLRMTVDMVILLVGMEPCTSGETLKKDNSIETDENGFFRSKNIHSERNASTHEGVFIAGSCICPMPVNETIENARSAALAVSDYLKQKQ
ncbi:MAG: FAD-dependent oxidoreductase [Mariniphaga sp.]